MRARLLVWCGDAVHSEQTVGGEHFILYSRHHMSYFFHHIVVCFFYKSDSWNTVFILCCCKVVGWKLRDSQLKKRQYVLMTQKSIIVKR